MLETWSKWLNREKKTFFLLSNAVKIDRKLEGKVSKIVGNQLKGILAEYLEAIPKFSTKIQS